MRLGSLHPRLLDRAVRVALWRERLLAPKRSCSERPEAIAFIAEQARFRATNHPVLAIAAYLRAVERKATKRGYKFNSAKISPDFA
jgi:hypothetical protein